MTNKNKETNETNFNPDNDLSTERFDLVLKRHGFGFHYSVLNEINRIFNAHGHIGSAWGLSADEFPVDLMDKGSGYHISSCGKLPCWLATVMKELH